VKYKVGLLGATGRMGLEVASLLAESEQFELADAVAASKKYSSIEGTALRKPNEPPREPVHLWIDFSTPTATMRLLNDIHVPIVIGTTGFSNEDRAAIARYAREHAVLLSSNMSPGMAVLRSFLRGLPRASEVTWDVVLSEMHHRRKQDSPSGTAKALMEILQEKGFSKIDLQVARVGEVIGNHEIKLISNDEEIVILHRATNRQVFARGALQAAEFLIRQGPGLYTMDDLFKSEGNVWLLS